MFDKAWLDLAIKFHGHKCPAMPLGLRAGWYVMEKLGVERASNKELFCFLEAGPSHAQMCFGDGVQVATGCTLGKENMEKLNYSKLGIVLIDVKKKKAVRVVIRPEFQKKGLASKFILMRKEGIEPKDIPSDIVDPMIDNIMKQPQEALFKISDVYDFDLKRTRSTFDWHECEKCGEIVFSHGIKVKEGKKLCLPCHEGKGSGA